MQSTAWLPPRSTIESSSPAATTADHGARAATSWSRTTSPAGIVPRVGSTGTPSTEVGLIAMPRASLAARRTRLRRLLAPRSSDPPRVAVVGGVEERPFELRGGGPERVLGPGRLAAPGEHLERARGVLRLRVERMGHVREDHDRRHLHPQADRGAR